MERIMEHHIVHFFTVRGFQMDPAFWRAHFGGEWTHFKWTSKKRTRVNLEFPLKCAFTDTALYPLPFGAVKLVFFRGEWGHSNLCKRRYRPCYDFTPITDLL